MTLRDVYNAIDRLESKLDTQISANSKRIDALETFRDRWIGIVTVGAAVISFFSGWIRERLFG